MLPVARRAWFTICFVLGEKVASAAPAPHVQDMLKDLGAVEVTDDMIEKSLNEGRRKKAEAARKAEARVAEMNKDPLEKLRDGGLDVTETQEAKIRESPDSVKEAMDESVAQATQLAMYQQARCGGCSVVAEVLGSDMQAAWKKGWSKDSVLNFVQNFCESKALPGGYQVVAFGNPEDTTEYVYVVEKYDGVSATTPHSEATIRRICKEQVDDLDGEIAKQAVKLTKVAQSSHVYSVMHHAELFQRGFNYTLCTAPCGGKKTKQKQKQVDQGIKVEL
jgi:hypothetical protein